MLTIELNQANRNSISFASQSEGEINLMDFDNVMFYNPSIFILFSFSFIVDGLEG